MKLSTRARYALRLMLEVARHSASGETVSLAAVAARTGLSHGYLEQLAQLLRNARLLRGRCGKQGGYQLARPPAAITLRGIVEAVIGPINLVECVGEPRSCLASDYCECRPVYRLVNRAVTEALEQFSLQDMLTPEWLENIEKTLEAPLFNFAHPGGGRAAERPDAGH